MRRHSFIARLSPADNVPVDIVQSNSHRTEIRFVDGHRRLGFGLGSMIEKLLARGICPSDAAA